MAGDQTRVSMLITHSIDDAWEWLGFASTNRAQSAEKRPATFSKKI
jgi:hypothetical protein